MKIKITSDSTCDLSPELLKKHDITMVSLSVIKDGKDFKDRVTITPAEIFDHVASGGELCSTSAVSIGEYTDVFEQYAHDYDGVIHINLGSGFSTCYQSACLAAEEFDNVRIIDSKNLTCGQGFVVLKACELAQTMDDLDAIADELNRFTEKVECSFLVDKLDYLVKGGRCSSAAALGANLLNLKPCIEVKDNKMSVVKKYRGNFTKALTSYIKDRLEDREDLDRAAAFLVQTVVSDEAYQGVLDMVNCHGHFETVHEATAGCTISCHCGPGTLGIILVRK